MRFLRSGFVGLVFVLAVFAATGAAAAQQDEHAELMEVVRAAEQLVQQQRPDDALQELEKVFEKTDEFAPAYFVAGLAYESKSDAQPAYDNFVKAAEYQPGWGIAHRKASFWAANIGNLDDSWDQAIKAHLAGTDMNDAFEGLQTMGTAPDDFQRRLAAYRVLVSPMNLEQYLGSEENPFGRQIDENGSSTNTDNISNSRATGVADRVVIESAADRASVLRRTQSRLAESRQFGLVGNQEQAQLLLVIEVYELGEDNANRRLRGYFNLIDARSGERRHRIRVEMRNIASQAEINRDLDRIIGLLEEWAEKQGR